MRERWWIDTEWIENGEMCGINTKVIPLLPDYVSPVFGAFMLIREFNFNFHRRKQIDSLKVPI
jgi:hypothetical protein